MEIEYRSDKILKLRVFRVKHRISLAELAQASSVSIQRISQIELMDCPLTPHIEEQLTRALESCCCVAVLMRRRHRGLPRTERTAVSGCSGNRGDCRWITRILTFIPAEFHRCRPRIRYV